MLAEKEKLKTSDVSQFTGAFDILFNKNPNNIAPDAPIYIMKDMTITYSELRDLILKCAFNLKERFNIQKGDVVAIRSSLVIEYPILLHGAVCAGATVGLVVCTPEEAAEKVALDLEILEPKVFIIEDDVLGISVEAATRAGIPKSNILVISDKNKVQEDGFENVQDILLSGKNLATPCTYTQYEYENQPAFLLFTSGSTGRRKAVMRTQRSMCTYLQMSTRAWSLTPSALLSCKKPAHYSSSLNVEMMVAILCGVKVILTKKDGVEYILKDIETYKINMILAAPHVWRLLSKSDTLIKKYDISSLRKLYSTGNMLPVNLNQRVKELFGSYIGNAYGATEFSSPFQLTGGISEKGAIGHLIPQYTGKIIDEQGNKVMPGEPGELVVKGPMVTVGYYKDPKATANALTDDGYFRSGDRFICDEDNLYWFLSRISNIIKCYGQHVYPKDVEKAVLSHPKVLDCGVVGVFSKELAWDLIKAYIELENKEDYINKDVLEKEILEYTNNQLPERKRITGGLVIMDKLPRTSTGKIMYGELKKLASSGSEVTMKS